MKKVQKKIIKKQKKKCRSYKISYNLKMISLDKDLKAKSRNLRIKLKVLEASCKKKKHKLY